MHAKTHATTRPLNRWLLVAGVCVTDALVSLCSVWLWLTHRLAGTITIVLLLLLTLYLLQRLARRQLSWPDCGARLIAFSLGLCGSGWAIYGAGHWHAWAGVVVAFCLLSAFILYCAVRIGGQSEQVGDYL